MIEPIKNENGLRRVGVMVGDRTCPPAEQVRGSLERLIKNGKLLSPIEWYKEFELIHPFVDGNGRTGKVLLAWLRKDFDNPEFPPEDLFGTPTTNP